MTVEKEIENRERSRYSGFKKNNKDILNKLKAGGYFLLKANKRGGLNYFLVYDGTESKARPSQVNSLMENRYVVLHDNNMIY
jgi:hypothetical protein